MRATCPPHVNRLWCLPSTVALREPAHRCFVVHQPVVEQPSVAVDWEGRYGKRGHFVCYIARRVEAAEEICRFHRNALNREVNSRTEYHVHATRSVSQLRFLLVAGALSATLSIRFPASTST